MTVASALKQTIASIKGVQGSLRIYATQTQDKDTELVYNDAYAITGEVINDLEKRLQKLEFQEPQFKWN